MRDVSSLNVEGFNVKKCHGRTLLTGSGSSLAH